MSSIFDSTKPNSSSGGSGVGGFNLVRTATNYTALSLDLIEADVTAGPITITAPASGMFTVVDIVKLAGTNNITISRTAGIKINGVDSDYVLNKLGSNFFFVYDETNQNWFVQDNSEQITDFVSQEYTGVATAGQTTITPGFTWKTAFTGKALFISGVKQAPNSYTVNSIGGGLSSQITLSEALVGGETIDFTALDVSSVPSLQGIVDTLALQPTQITNAGFGVWSNGTLESAVSSVNLITNGEFETDTSGWNAGNSATLTRDTATSANGTACLKVTNSGATFGIASWQATTVVGRVYKVAAYLKIGTALTAQLSVGTLPSEANIASTNTSSATWVKAELIFEAVGTTTYVHFVNNNASGGTAYYDSISLYDMGANLVTNGTFNSNTTGWTAVSATLASVTGGMNGNMLKVECSTAGTYGQAYQQISNLTPGKLYKLSFWYKNGTSSGCVNIGTILGGNDIYTFNYSSTGLIFCQILFEAIGATAFISLVSYSIGGSGNYAHYDSVTLTEVTVGCVDYNSKALDLWTKDNAAQCWRETINTKAGAYYALRVYNGSVYWSDGNRAARPEFYSRYAGRPTAKGIWVRCSSANKARIGITDSAGTTWSSYHSGGGSYEWLEVTRTPGTGINSFYVALDSGTGTEAQFSQPQLMFGTSVGSGNFVPIPNEFIYFDSILSKKFSTWSGYISNTHQLSAMADSGGVIPKGCKAFKITAKAFDTSSAATSASFGTEQSGAAPLVVLSPNTSNYDIKTGSVRCLSDGSYPLTILASGTNTFYLQYWYQGVQL